MKASLVTYDVKVLYKTIELKMSKVVVPSPGILSWDACSMTHLETHFSMHLK
jgi:hypothetical protein